jgi:hypothetical protein
VSILIWLGIWLGLIAATAFAYWQLFSTLAYKAKVVAENLAKGQQRLQELVDAVGKPVKVPKQPSALESDFKEVLANHLQLEQQRERAKALRERRLIKGLKNLKLESEQS